MLEDRFIDVWAYNLETVLAEKLETIITRATTNTRMRDFYDIHILLRLKTASLLKLERCSEIPLDLGLFQQNNS